VQNRNAEAIDLYESAIPIFEQRLGPHSASASRARDNQRALETGPASGI
jgi:hypothetical protein